MQGNQFATHTSHIKNVVGSTLLFSLIYLQNQSFDYRSFLWSNLVERGEETGVLSHFFKSEKQGPMTHLTATTKLVSVHI